MEAALRTPEVLDLIFRHLRFTQELTVQDARVITGQFLGLWQKKRMALLNAALACKAFFEPAMANLWWRVNGFMPFIKLLPNVSVKVSQNAYDYMTGREWTLEEELHDKGLERFDFYAKMVTHILDLGRKGDDNLSVLLIQLAEIRPSGCCFPKLQSVKALHYNPDPWLFYTAPTLRELVILAQNYAEDIRLKSSLSTMIGRLPTRSPELSVVQIPFLPHERSLKSLLRLPNLRQLTIKYTTTTSPPISEILGELSALPRLEMLDLYCPLGMGSHTPLVPPSTEFSPEWYPQLTSLAVAGSPQNIQDVLLYLGLKPLEEVTLRLSWPEPKDPSEASNDVAALTMTVQTMAESLKSMSITCEPSNPIYSIASLRSVPLDTQFLSHLLALPHLEVLHLGQSLSVPTLTDAFLPSIPHNWQKLRKLSLPQALPTHPITQRTAALTFVAVQQMIQDLPELTELSLEFAAGDTPAPDLVAPQLRILDVRSSPVSNKRRTALNIAEAFPNLEKLVYTAVAESHSASARLFADAWKEVATWLPVLTGKYSGEEDEGEVGFVARGVRTFGEMIAAHHPVVTYADDEIDDDYEFDDDSDDPLGYGADDF